MALDTPYGFQENADQLSARTADYFRQSVGYPIDVASFRRADIEPADRERAMAQVRAAAYAFAGPGSPTYSLRQWDGSPLPDILADKLAAGGPGGCVTFASAAALTLGRSTIPVYEIYKAGLPPAWVDGLDLLSAFGLTVAVIPHYDNAEGGTHDTRYCYLGERRLRMLEAELPDGAFVLGVDEHTAAIIDIDADTLTVEGQSAVHVRRDGRTVSHASGALVPLAEIRDPNVGGDSADVAGGVGGGTAFVSASAPAASGDQPGTGLLADAQEQHDAFESAIGVGTSTRRWRPCWRPSRP